MYVLMMEYPLKQVRLCAERVYAIELSVVDVGIGLLVRDGALCL